MNNEQLILQFKNNIERISASLQVKTRHRKDTIESWKTTFKGKRIRSSIGEDLGVVQFHIDSTDHIFVSVGGSTFPVGHLQALVDAGSLLVVDS